MEQLAGFPVIEPERDEFREFGKQMGRDEMFAGVMSAMVTLLARITINFFYGGIAPGWMTVIVLPFVGPAFEKVGMTIPYMRKAAEKKRRGKDQRSLTKLFLAQLREDQFLRVIRADIIWHDSAYSALMFAGTALLAAKPAWLPAWTQATWFSFPLSAICFLIGLAWAITAEVKFGQWSFQRLLKRLAEEPGVTVEHYGEVRYLVPDIGAPDEFLAVARSEFDLSFNRHQEHVDWIVNGVEVEPIGTLRGFVQVRQSGGIAKLHIVYYQTRICPPSQRGLPGAIFVEKYKIAVPIDGWTEGSGELARLVERTIAAIRPKLITGPIILVPRLRYRRTYGSNGASISFAVDTIEGRAEGLVEVKVWLPHVRCLAHADALLRRTRTHVATTQPRSFTPEMLDALMAQSTGRR